MLRKIFLLLLLSPMFAFAQDQDMKVYASGAYANRPLLYVSLLTKEDVEKVIAVFGAVSISRIPSIDLEPLLMSDTRMRITTCSGYVMVFEAATCEGGEYYF